MMTARKLMFVLFGGFVLLIVGTGLGVNYVYGLLQDNARTTSHVKIDAELNDQVQTSLQHIQLKFNSPDVEKLSEYMKQIVPDSSYRSQFVTDLYKYASDSKVTISGLNFLDKGVVATPAPAGVATTSMTLVIASGASFENFTGFLKKLENNLQHVQITSLNMQPDMTSPGTLSTATLNLEVFTQK